MNLNNVRKRKSYKMFEEYLEYMKTHTPEECLVKLHHILDDRFSYGSIKASNYAFESLSLVLKDKKRD